MKRKFAVLALVLGIVLLVTACSCNHQFNDTLIIKKATCTESGQELMKCDLCGESETKEIPRTKHKYKEEIIKEATFYSAGEKKYTCELCGYSYKKEIPKSKFIGWNDSKNNKADKNVVKVSVADKISIPEGTYDGQNYKSITFKFNIENTSDKPIKGIEGRLNISDIFGNAIGTFNCNITGQVIPAKKSVSSDISFRIDQYKDTDIQIYNANFSDLKFKYIVDDIVFANESDNDYYTQENIPVELKITNKESIPKDIYNGYYYPRIKLNFEVTNNSDKDIKGVSGELRVDNIFGKNVTNILLDSTEGDIAIGETVKSSAELEVNEFSNEQMTFYNTSYSGLVFEYKIKSIVYTDGTRKDFR